MVDLALFIATPAVDAVEYMSVVQIVEDYLTANQPTAANLLRGTLGTADLDSITTPGMYRQGVKSGATEARHYPLLERGVLTVASTGILEIVIADAYSLWDQRTHNGRLWESTVAGVRTNTWAPNNSFGKARRQQWSSPICLS